MKINKFAGGGVEGHAHPFVSPRYPQSAGHYRGSGMGTEAMLNAKAEQVSSPARQQFNVQGVK